MDDKIVINAFVDHLGIEKYPAIKIDRWPDEENRSEPDIDAIAGSLAIEHTSIDSIPNQRRNSDWFMQVVDGLEDEFPKISFRLNITLKYEAVTIGQDWLAIRQALKQWINTTSINLYFGTHSINTIPGVPFDITVRKSDRTPGIIFSRIAPDDHSLPERLRKQVDRKIKKLIPYKANGFITLLLLENEDIALMNELVMLRAIRDAYPCGFPQELDEVWYADTSLPTDIAFYEFTHDLRK